MKILRNHLTMMALASAGLSAALVARPNVGEVESEAQAAPSPDAAPSMSRQRRRYLERQTAKRVRA